MKKLNLQLFALKLNTGTSIVDYLKSNGQDSSYSNRKKLASKYGINNYTGTADQNTKLLQMLKNSSATKTTNNAVGAGTAGATSKVASNATNATQKRNVGTVGSVVQTASNVLAEKNNANTVSVSASKGNTGGSITPEAAQNIANLISQGKVKIENIPEQFHSEILGYIDSGEKSGSTVTPTQAPTYKPAQTQTPKFEQTQLPTYNGTQRPAQSATSMSDRLGVDTLGKLNSQFQVSQAYTDAMNYTNQLLQQLGTGKTSYSDQLSQIMSDYANREKFSYDMNTDPLFQQALSSAMASGKTAMSDTMGQAAALTGGYGSSYATNVGANAYNKYIQEAYDQLPQYYQMALDAYNMEGDSMLNQFNMYSQADANEYDRLMNAYNANFNNAQTMYGNEYQAWADSVNNAFNYAQMQNSDYWNQMNYDEGVRQYEQNFDYQKYLDQVQQSQWQNEFNYGMFRDEVADNKWNTEFEYKDYLTQLDQYNKDRDYATGREDTQWEQNFTQSEADRNQGNIDREFEADRSDTQWEQNYKEDVFAEEKENTDWEQSYKDKVYEADREDTKWEQDYKTDVFEEDKANTDWEQKYKEDVFEEEKAQNAADNQYRNDALAQDDKHFNAEMDLSERKFEEDIRQFNETLVENARQFDEGMNLKIQAAQAESEASMAEEGADFKVPKESMYSDALTTALSGGAGELVRYLQTIPEYDVGSIIDYVKSSLTFTKTKETINGLWGVDNNDVVTDQYGTSYKLSALKDKYGLTKAQLKKFNEIGEGEEYCFVEGLEGILQGLFE